MLKYNIRFIMKMRGVTNPIAFLKENGFTKSTAVRIAADKMLTLKLSHIEKLCLALNCLPSDLYCWIPDKDETANENHPLRKILQKEMQSLAEICNEIPAGKIPEFLEKVKQIEDGMKV